MPESTVSEDQIPEQIGKYPVQQRLGRGATSTVYRAHDPFAGRDVAIKLMDAAVFEGEEDALARSGFLVEASLVGKLDHPHVTRIYDVVDEADQHFVVMEYVAGGTLERYCHPGSLMDTDSAIDVVFKAAKALEYVHGIGLVHRDIKPANILIHEGTDIRVSDFGAALARESARSAHLNVGSPLYMSPEQVKGLAVDFQSDMFSLGVVFYHLLTGHPPFRAASLEALRYQIAEIEPAAPSEVRPGLTPAMDEFLMQALRKVAQDRFDSWEAFCQALTCLAEVQSDSISENALDSQTGRYSLLRRCAFFARFADSHLWEVLENARFVRAVEGDVIMRDGDPGDRFHVILAGRVRVTKRGRLLNVLEAGAVIGEMSYVLDYRQTRTATCACLSDAILLEVSIDWLREASSTCRSSFERTFMVQLAERLQDANARLVSG